ncbi:MAG: hypothetical protein KAU48_03340, partial [Candidatus Thorarchaeota archaeon]|nr:hypothetical protein [Candidatus Thorarchaeota archaeon]
MSVLVNGAPADKVKELLDSMVTTAKDFSEQYGNKISSMSTVDIKEMLSSLQNFQVEFSDAIRYGRLRFRADTTNKESNQINGWSRQTMSSIGQTLKSIDLHLGKLLSEKPELIQDSELSEFKHYLERLYNTSRYHLTEGEEKAIIQKDLNGIRLFSQLQESWVSEKTFEVEIEGEKKTLTYNELSSLRMNPNRNIRR